MYERKFPPIPSLEEKEKQQRNGDLNSDPVFITASRDTMMVRANITLHFRNAPYAFITIPQIRQYPPPALHSYSTRPSTLDCYATFNIYLFIFFYSRFFSLSVYRSELTRARISVMSRVWSGSAYACISRWGGQQYGTSAISLVCVGRYSVLSYIILTGLP